MYNDIVSLFNPCICMLCSYAITKHNALRLTAVLEAVSTSLLSLKLSVPFSATSCVHAIVEGNQKLFWHYTCMRSYRIIYTCLRRVMNSNFHPTNTNNVSIKMWCMCAYYV